MNTPLRDRQSYGRKLTEKELAQRWRVSERKLQSDRQNGRGIAYQKIGNRVIYDLGVVEEHEVANTFSSTAQYGSGQ
jgi:hypothetical protein